MSKQDGSGRQVSDETVDSSTAIILHVDLDAFFASVELLDRPELADRPVLVAGKSARSVVTAANYPARKFGARSAMPLGQALRLCPDAVVLEPHFDKYRHYSAIVMGIFEQVTPVVERVGIDEAFLDVAGSRRAVGSPATVGALIRRRVFEQTRLACSVGAGVNKFVAKVASGLAKPDGMLIVPAQDTLAFLHPLPVASLWGVGAATEEALQGRGLRTIGDIAAASPAMLQRAVGVASGSRLHDLANGIDPRPVRSQTAEKSIGQEVTFEVDVVAAEALRRELLRQSNAIAARLRSAGWVGRTVVLKLRFADFRTVTRSRTLEEPTDLGRRVFEEVLAIYRQLGAHGPVRLIGVRVEQLVPVVSRQLPLWDEHAAWREAESAVDGISERFGRGALGPASLIVPAKRTRPSHPDRHGGIPRG